MKINASIALLGISLLTIGAYAQNDSTAVAQTLDSLLSSCKNVDFADEKVTELGTFYKAAQYIVYRGEDENRKWKDFADYTKEEDKKGVDNICLRINRSVNQSPKYTVEQYLTDKESEGVWHILLVSYKHKNEERKAAFAFLKINGRYALGDID